MFVPAHIVIDPADQTLIDRFQQNDVPLLPILHAFHNRDGYLSQQTIEAVGKALRIPLAELYGTVTFYHHFAQEPGGLQSPRVCDGPICCQRGSDAVLAALDGATPMPCAGRCDDPIPVLIGGETHVARFGQDDSVSLERLRSSPIPAPNPGGLEEVIFRHVRETDRTTLVGYRRTGGYDGLREAVAEGTPEDLVALIKESKLAGRGGAGFPTGVKWEAVAKAPWNPADGPKSIICNADEGEPGCFKDRAIMDHDPFAVLEGMTLAGYASGATRGFIYLRYEYPETEARLNDAIAAAEFGGWLGDAILGTDFNFHITVVRGAGAYVCGEETSLLNSLEGKHPFPRNKPPYPTTHGFQNLPTVVNNVETLAAAAQIARKGADWYRGLGTGEHAGTKIISLSGDVMRPGNYEVPFGLPLQTLLHEWAGGPLPGRTIQAVTMAGLSGGFLAGDDLNVTLDDPSIKSRGSFLGAGGIMVFDDSRDMVEIARQGMAFFAHESCGKCFPCRIGTQRLTERLAGEGPGEFPLWLAEVNEISTVMKSLSACGLGIAAPLVAESLVKYFGEEIRERVGE